MSTKRCRHERNSWIICGGYAEWCYVCGAWRKLEPISPNSSRAASTWARPSGNPAVNPFDSIKPREARP